ncbi:pinensin family lanthipeptide [Roseivirga sp. BDSF3-8]|uniref:pinensin family lanthipeptide n=1 Tax=Roseivirga sp. BDSF3-8 TaxID=3241598 RepID=UPI003531F85A
MKKMKLNDLKLKSFVTGIENNTVQTAKGGAPKKETGLNDPNCSWIDACPTLRGCTIDTCI